MYESKAAEAKSYSSQFTVEFYRTEWVHAPYADPERHAEAVG